MPTMSMGLTEHTPDRIGLTWAEFVALPYETRNTDLIDGKLVVNSPNATHELVVQNVIAAIRRWRAEQAAVPGSATTQQLVKVNDRRGYQPDVSWYPESQCSRGERGIAFTGQPSIVIEVLSPSTRGVDLIRKRGDYERLGIKEYWVFDPVHASALILWRESIDEPFRHEDDDEFGPGEIMRSYELAGFETPVGELFTDR
jgi:Uma2 family endonuclease